MSERQPCQGGFCHLHLPTGPNIPSCNSKQKLNKREKRLLKSLRRDRATKLLQWTLRDEEYSRLEENGDLVRLRVRDCNADGVGSWVKRESVQLARREHRPELAKLAFAEFSSQLDQDGSCAGNASSDCDPVMIEPPPQDDGLQDNVLVCGICSTVHHLLEQSRELLSSHDEMPYDEMQQQEDETDGECNNCNESEPAEDLSVTINRVDNIPSNTLKKSKTEGPNSKQWEDAKQQSSPPRSPSFHGPVNIWSDGPPHVSFVRKRDMKQMEENSKIRILIAESDDVSEMCYCNNHLFI